MASNSFKYNTMGSLESLTVRSLQARGIAAQVVADTPVAIRIRHTGPSTVTSVTVTTGTGIVFVSDTFTQSYTFADYATVGALADAINQGLSTEEQAIIVAGTTRVGSLWEAKVLDSLRSYASATQFVNGAITVGTLLEGAGTAEQVWDVKVDTSAALYVAYRLTYDRGFTKGHKKNHRVHLQEIEYYADLTAAADKLQVWEADGTIEFQKFGKLSVDTTVTTVNFSNGEGKLTAGEGNDIIVVLKTAGALPDTALSLLVTGIVE